MEEIDTVDELFQIIANLKTQIDILSTKYAQLAQSGKLGNPNDEDDTKPKTVVKKRVSKPTKTNIDIEIGTIELNNHLESTTSESTTTTTQPKKVSTKQPIASAISKKIKRPLWVDFVENA